VRHNNFFIDYETYWGTKYSLRTGGMSYTDFVLDPKFQIHGASVAVNDEPAMFLRGNSLTKAVQMAGMRDMRYIAHNVMFDSTITSFNQGVRFPEYFCTLAMVDAMWQGGIGRGLDECMKVLLGREGKTDIIKELKDVRTEDITPQQWRDLEKYANEDLEATRELYLKYGPCLPQTEHRIMDIILRMYADPKLEFNPETLYEAVKEADDDREERIQAALDYGATVEILRGNKLFPEFLDDLGIKVPYKKNPKGIMIPAFAKTDAAFQQMLESEDPQIHALANGRLAVKSTQATTRAYRFKKLHEQLGFCPVAYNYARAHTWRLSGGNKINMANLKRGSKLRLCVQAPPGYRLVVADASQIECRKNAYIAGQEDLIQLFRDKQDPYNDMASDIFGRAVDRKRKDANGNEPDFFEGFIGKTATLGLGFGMGGPKFAATVKTNAKTQLGMDVEWTEQQGYDVVNLYRRKNWKIKAFWGVCTEFLYTMVNNREMKWEYPDGEIRCAGRENKLYFPNGTWLYYPALSHNEDGFTYQVKQGARYISKYIYGGLMCENIVQHMSRNVTADHMVQIAERYPVVMHTYDENIALVPDAEADAALEWMIDIMSTPPDWCKSIPLAAEGGHAREYSK
jgi:DNA polymerase